MHLRDLVDPVPAEEFLNEIFGRSPRLFTGDPDRFASLISWDTLSDIAPREHVTPLRLRVARGAEDVPETEYIHTVSTPEGDAFRTVRMPELMSVLRQGATLIVDAVDRVHPPVELLAHRLEHTLREPVQINAYGTWGTDQGFSPHWDDHDVLVLQVAGEKEWTLYGPPRRSWPLGRDIEENPMPEDESELNVLTLAPGDVLHVPRGWWHGVRPVKGPTLHLTVAVPRTTGIDLVNWLADQVCCEPGFRKDLPRYGPADDRTRHMTRLRDTLSSLLEEPGLLERFFLDRDACAPVRQRFSLAAVDELTGRLGDGEAVTWLAPRAVLLDEGERVALLANGRRRTFTASAGGMLEHLLAEMETTAGRVIGVGVSEPGIGEPEARAFLTELVDAGLVAVGGSGTPVSARPVARRPSGAR